MASVWWNMQWRPTILSGADHWHSTIHISFRFRSLRYTTLRGHFVPRRLPISVLNTAIRFRPAIDVRGRSARKQRVLSAKLRKAAESGFSFHQEATDGCSADLQPAGDFRFADACIAFGLRVFCEPPKADDPGVSRSAVRGRDRHGRVREESRVQTQRRPRASRPSLDQRAWSNRAPQ